MQPIFQPQQFMVPSQGMAVWGQGGISYTLGAPINQGGFAMVYEAWDEFYNPVALKVLRPMPDAVALHQQWTHEQELFRRLRHPNVVTIYDAFGWNNLFYLALERAETTISGYVSQTGPLQDWIVREVARQLLFGLHFIHSSGVLHKDLTINNVLVFTGPQNRGPIFKISDFGISRKSFSPWDIQPPEINNTTFLLPELLQSEFGLSSERSDLYHLGLILLFCLKGYLPLREGMSPMEIDHVVRNAIPRQEAEALGTPLGNFISVLLRRHADARYQSALDAWRALKLLPGVL